MKYKFNHYFLAVILTIFAIGCATTQSESTTQSEIITVESSELITAVRNGKTDTVKALLEAGADVNAPSNIYGTPLRIASFYGYTEIVKALVAAGADVNANDSTGETALMAASGIGRGGTETVKALLEAGADVNQPDVTGDTALMKASLHDRTEIVKALLEAGAEVNQHDNRGVTALMTASLLGHTETVQALLAAGADVNHQHNRGDTALMFASLYGHTETIKSLLEAGADVNQHDDRGETALMTASGKGYTETVKALLAAGADVNMEGNSGETALGFAKKSKHKATVQLLEEAGARESSEKKVLKVLNEDRLHARVQERWAAFGRGDIDTYASFLDPMYKKSAKSEGLTLREYLGYEAPEETPSEVVITTTTKICSCEVIEETSMSIRHTSCRLQVNLKNETTGDEGGLTEYWSNKGGEWFWSWTADFAPC